MRPTGKTDCKCPTCCALELVHAPLATMNEMYRFRRTRVRGMQHVASAPLGEQVHARPTLRAQDARFKRRQRGTARRSGQGGRAGARGGQRPRSRPE